MLLFTMLLAVLIPCHDQSANIFKTATFIAIAMLFFFHGAKMELTVLFAALSHWRLHLVIFCTTFIYFPFISILLTPLMKPILDPPFYIGFLFLCSLPSTVQSSIAFTSIARGNIAAALCSSSISSILGIFLTPLLMIFLLRNQQSVSTLMDQQSFFNLIKQLLLPFLLGLGSRRFIASWIDKHIFIIRIFDQSSVLLVVYTALSATVVEGVWHQFTWPTLAIIIFLDLIILLIALLTTFHISKLLNFCKADQITILFCGSKKSLVNGIPLANILFSPTLVGQIVLPIILFHQLQLIVCSVLAKQFARQQDH